jgi:hypothetical protein
VSAPKVTLAAVDVAEALALLRGLYEPIVMLGKHASGTVPPAVALETLDKVRNVVSILESAERTEGGAS